MKAFSLIGSTLFITLLAQPALAARGGGNSPGPGVTDIAISLTGPQQSLVYTDTTYSVNVTNLSKKTADKVRAVIALPLTDTSPQTYILGTVSTADQRCTILNNQLVCSLGSMAKNATTSFSFTYNAPISSKQLVLTAEAVTDSTDTNTDNNVHSFVVSPIYTPTTLTGGTVINEHCTGQGLTSYYECTLFPSSITSHVATFNSDSTLTVETLTGAWTLIENDTRLRFVYFDDQNQVIASFNGYAADNKCFEGITTFPNSTYVSPYRVCF